MPRGGGRSGGGRSGGGKGMPSFFPRLRGGGSGGSTKKSPELKRAPVAAPAAAPPPRPAPMQAGSSTEGIGAAIKDGLAFGGGNAVAQRGVDAVIGPRTIRHEKVATAIPASVIADSNGSSSSLGSSSDACGDHMKAFRDCLNTYGSEISKCQSFMDMLSECRKYSLADSAAGLNA